MVRNHIKLFPAVESHYSRAKSYKEYLDGSLTLTKMYDLYKVTDENSVKENINRKVFNEEINLSFFKPKKDRCDECEEYKILEQPSEERKYLQELHIQRKISGFDERTKDRQIINGIIVVVFDLENVFNLPKAYLSRIYY